MSTENKRPTLVKAEKYGYKLIRSTFSAYLWSVACCKYVMSVLIRVVNLSPAVALPRYDILAISFGIGFNKNAFIRLRVERSLPIAFVLHWTMLSTVDSQPAGFVGHTVDCNIDLIRFFDF